MYENTDALAVVRALRPDEPITLIRPHAATRAARFFVEKFQGKSLYAVKANPSPASAAAISAVSVPAPPARRTLVRSRKLENA